MKISWLKEVIGRIVTYCLGHGSETKKGITKKCKLPLTFLSEKTKTMWDQDCTEESRNICPIFKNCKKCLLIVISENTDFLFL